MIRVFTQKELNSIEHKFCDLGESSKDICKQFKMGLLIFCRLRNKHCWKRSEEYVTEVLANRRAAIARSRQGPKKKVRRPKIPKTKMALIKKAEADRLTIMKSVAPKTLVKIVEVPVVSFTRFDPWVMMLAKLPDDITGRFDEPGMMFKEAARM